MIKIPLEKIPNQIISVTLDDQKCTFHIYQRGQYLFLDLAIDGEDIKTGCIALSSQSAIGPDVKDFSGHLYWLDVVGNNGVPHYSELNDRFELIFMSDEDIEELAEEE